MGHQARRLHLKLDKGLAARRRERTGRFLMRSSGRPAAWMAVMVEQGGVFLCVTPRKGFPEFGRKTPLKAVLSGKGDEILDLAMINLWRQS